MHIQFTHHAQYRLYGRNFSVEQMKETILNPDYSRESFDGKIVSSKTFNRTILEVVYKIVGNTYLIITVYFK